MATIAENIVDAAQFPKMAARDPGKTRGLAASGPPADMETAGNCRPLPLNGAGPRWAADRRLLFRT
jgi:hypothetical protein